MHRDGDKGLLGILYAVVHDFFPLIPAISAPAGDQLRESAFHLDRGASTPQLHTDIKQKQLLSEKKKRKTIWTTFPLLRLGKSSNLKPPTIPAVRLVSQPTALELFCTEDGISNLDKCQLCLSIPVLGGWRHLEKHVT